MKNLSWLLFGLMVLLQWVAPVRQILKYERVLAEGTLVRFKCRAPDPYDPLRGRYLAVAVENTRVPSSSVKGFNEGHQVYADIVVGADGMATFGKVSATPPAAGLYLACKMPSYFYGDDVSLVMPFDRYYLNEAKAPAADRWMATMRTERTKPTWVEVRVRDGVAVIVDIKHAGVSLADAIK